ncbi:hypothetical protein KAR91_70995 [Candidatus Pacearchaeota archaeon]|nr:hypothetical protein [Candidatus Pacearchaeota archaeon]
MSEEIVVPPEVKREIAISSLWSIIMGSLASTSAGFFGVSYGVDWDEYIEKSGQISKMMGEGGVKQTIEGFKIPGDDCVTTAKAHQIMVDAMGFEPKIIEMTPERAVVHETKCPMLEAAKAVFPKFLEIPVDKMSCTVFDRACGTVVNPNITLRKGETICQGGTVCEHIWELKR